MPLDLLPPWPCRRSGSEPRTIVVAYWETAGDHKCRRSACGSPERAPPVRSLKIVIELAAWRALAKRRWKE